MEWDDLDPTTSGTIRHCGICGKDVHFCESPEALAKAVLENLCVAIPAAALEGHGFDTVSPKANLNNPETLLGDIAGFD
jgi:hypothetical protein